MASASKLFARKLFAFVSIVGKHHLELRGGENFLCSERVLSKREIFSEDLHEKKKRIARKCDLCCNSSPRTTDAQWVRSVLNSGSKDLAIGF